MRTAWNRLRIKHTSCRIKIAGVSQVTNSPTWSEVPCVFVHSKSNLPDFKVQACRASHAHNHKHCPFYHSHKDRRRAGLYSFELCSAANGCPLGDACPKAHNRVEQLYHPDKYKTKFCTQYPDKLEVCDYGGYCSFAHADSEIKVPLIHHSKRDADFYMYHFKTVWCPFITAHDKALCVYAHNWQDCRRNPKQVNYEAEACSSWKAGTFILSYEEGGCEEMAECRKCHGWKELESHPWEYKTRPCTAGSSCTRLPDCPYFHSNKDRRSSESVVLAPPGFDNNDNKENVSSASLKLDIPRDDDLDLFRDIAAFVGQGPVRSLDLSVYRPVSEPSALAVQLPLEEPSIPKSLICPLTGKLMHDPVILPEDGRTYEYSAIVQVRGSVGLKRDEETWQAIAALTRTWV